MAPVLDEIQNQKDKNLKNGTAKKWDYVTCIKKRAILIFLKQLVSKT